MKKIIILFVIVMMTAGNAFGMVETSVTDDYTVYITIKPYVYSTGFCWYTQFKVKNNATKAYMYVFAKDKTAWNKYFEQSDFSDFSLTEGTSETNANGIYYKGWTGGGNYLQALIWSYNAAFQIIGKIQAEGKNCSLSISKTAFLDNKKVQYAVPEEMATIISEECICQECEECTDISDYLSDNLSEAERFTEGDGTIMDNATGLMWDWQNTAKKTYSNAIYYCSALSKGDFDDWRLPTPKELLTIVDYKRGGVSTSVIYDSVFQAGARLYWTTETYGNESATYQYVVNMKDGTLSGYPNYTDVYCWCVRNAE